MFFLFIFPLNKFIFLISSFFKMHFKINVKMILFIYLLYLSFWVRISLKIITGYKRRVEESRWEIINILEPERKEIPKWQISLSSHTFQIFRYPLPFNPFILLFYLKLEKVPIRLSSGASPPMSLQGILLCKLVALYQLQLCWSGPSSQKVLASNQFHSEINFVH